METVLQNGRFTLFSSNIHSNIYSILFGNGVVCVHWQIAVVSVHWSIYNLTYEYNK